MWDLVRMLATNQQMYDEVLSLSQAQTEDGINWSTVFEDSSIYKQIYKQEIIVAVMEASKGAEEKRVMFVSSSNYSVPVNTTKVVGQSGGAAGDDDDEEFKDDDDTAETNLTAEELAEQQRVEGLKTNWTSKFLAQHGFDFIL